MERSLANRSRMRLVRQPAFAAEDCRRYGPNEIPHPFCVTSMVVRAGGRIVKVLHLVRGEWIEVQSC